MKQLLLNEIEARPAEQVDLSSLKEIQQQPNEEVNSSIRITNCTDRTCELNYRGERLIPFVLLSNDGGVEFRGLYIFEYKAASEEYVAEVTAAREKRDSEIAHCQKLLNELPQALENSIQAMEKLADEVDGDSELSEVGAMVFEQRRIKKEIAAREAQLKQLDLTKRSKTAVRFDQTKFINVTRQSRIVMSFGFSRFEGQLYNVFRIEETLRHGQIDASTAPSDTAPTALRILQRIPMALLDLSDPSLILNHGQTLNAGDLIDCFDLEMKWRLAQVTAVGPSNLLVHYDGWSNRWDEWVERSSRKLQPAHTKTKGYYTGP